MTSATKLALVFISMLTWPINPLAAYDGSGRPEEPYWYILPDEKTIVGLIRDNGLREKPDELFVGLGSKGKIPAEPEQWTMTNTHGNGDANLSRVVLPPYRIMYRIT